MTINLTMPPEIGPDAALLAAAKAPWIAAEARVRAAEAAVAKAQADLAEAQQAARDAALGDGAIGAERDVENAGRAVRLAERVAANVHAAMPTAEADCRQALRMAWKPAYVGGIQRRIDAVDRRDELRAELAAADQAVRDATTALQSTVAKSGASFCPDGEVAFAGTDGAAERTIWRGAGVDLEDWHFRFQGHAPAKKEPV